MQIRYIFPSEFESMSKQFIRKKSTARFYVLQRKRKNVLMTLIYKFFPKIHMIY